MTANLLSVGMRRSIGERNEQPAFLALIKRDLRLDSYLFLKSSRSSRQQGPIYRASVASDCSSSKFEPIFTFATPLGAHKQTVIKCKGRLTPLMATETT